MNIPQIVTLIIFIASYLLIFTGKMERTAAALLGLCAMVASGYLFHFTNFEELLTHVNWEVVILLFGMMTYVGIMSKTGFFKYLGMKAIQLSKGKPWYIFLYLTLITTFVSMFVDNVTTILLIIPLTIQITDLIKINPVPLILGEALLSNIGGVGTLVGDPPNIMIGIASGYTFNDFIINLLPPVLISLVISLVLGRIVYHGWFKKQGENLDRLMEIDPRKYIENKKDMSYLLAVLIGMIFFFVIGEYIGIAPAFIALSGGVLALLISMEDPVEAFKSVEWSTLVFFIALFALVGGLTESGLLSILANSILSLHESPVLIALILLWVTAIASAVVDNIPITAAFIPVVSIMNADYPNGILWWALAMGVGIGGNMTYIGSSAGVITLSISKRYGHAISNKDWMKLGLPIGLVSLLICSAFIVFM